MITRDLHAFADAFAAAAPDFGAATARAVFLVAPDGFRLIVNTGRVGRQDVYHLHVHIIGGPDRLPRMIAAE